ncbi:MAG: methionine--tRNA ligase, partial [Sphingopyxis sp.]
VDALTSYMTALGYPDLSGDFARYWPADIHLIGKDIVRFHAVYWPAFLMSAGLPLPKQIFGHGFVLARGGEKMSKSAGNSADPMELAARFGVDQLRYFLLREISFGQDGSYSEEAIVTRCNADLANNFGNLAQRSLSMIAKNCGGRLPAPLTGDAADTALLNAIDSAQGRAASAMRDLAIGRALEAIWGAMSDANLYFAEQAPWALRKTDSARADTVLYTTAEALRRLAIMASWAIPDGAAKMLDLLAVPSDARGFAALGTPLVAGTLLPSPSGVFPRLELAAD